MRSLTQLPAASLWFSMLTILTCTCCTSALLLQPVLPPLTSQHHFSNTRRRHSPTQSFSLSKPSFLLHSSSGSSSGNTIQRALSASEEEGGVLWPTYSDDSTRHEDDGRYEEDSDEETAALFSSMVFDSVVKVHCTHSEPDCLMPWQRTQQSSSTSSGFVTHVPGIGVRVITNAHSVEYATSLQVQRRGEERKYDCVVEAVGNECDLALVRVEDEADFLEGLVVTHDDDDGTPLLPLQFGPLPDLQDEVEVLGYPTGGDSMSVTSGVVSRIEIVEYAQAGTHLLAIQIDAAINSGNSGGPVVNEEFKVVGVAFQTLDEAENIGYVIPVTVIRHFLEDVRRNKGRYTGFCSIGARLEFLENRAFRRSLGMVVEDDHVSHSDSDEDEDDDTNNNVNANNNDIHLSSPSSPPQTGIMVLSVGPTSQAAKLDLLRSNDVIMAVDGISISNDGKIPFRRGERVSLRCYIQTKFDGDTVRLNLLRNKEEIEVDVPVTMADRLVPAHWKNAHDEPPPYLIVSGLVFTVLSMPLLSAWGAWEEYTSDDMNYLSGLANHDPEVKHDRVVVLSQVLVHKENMGYDKRWAKHLDKYNGVKVRSLSHLKSLIDDNGKDEEFMRFEFAPHHDMIVMERSKMERVTKEICDMQSISRSSFIPSVEDNDESDT